MLRHFGTKIPKSALYPHFLAQHSELPPQQLELALEGVNPLTDVFGHGLTDLFGQSLRIRPEAMPDMLGDPLPPCLFGVRTCGRAITINNTGVVAGLMNDAELLRHNVSPFATAYSESDATAIASADPASNAAQGL